MIRKRDHASAAQRAGASLCLSTTVFLAGCARSPAFNVLGSYFPGWIACIAIGIVCAVGIHLVLGRFQAEGRIAGLPFFYLSLAVAIACLFWLVAFE